MLLNRVLFVALCVFCTLQCVAAGAPPGDDYSRFEGCAPLQHYKRVVRLGRFDSPVSQLAVSSNGRWIAAVSGKFQCVVFDVHARKIVGELKSAETFPISSLAVTEDGKYCAVGYYTGSVQVWNVETGKVEFTHNAMKSWVEFVSVSNDNQWMIAIERKGGIYRYPLLGGLGNTVRVSKSPVRWKLKSASADGSRVGFGLTRANTLFCRFPEPGGRDAPPIEGGAHPYLQGDVVALSSDGKNIAIGCNNKGKTTLVQVSNGRLNYGSAELDLPQLARATFVEKDTFVAMVGRNWIEYHPVDAMKSSTWCRLPTLEGTVTSHEMSADGRLLVTARQPPDGSTGPYHFEVVHLPKPQLSPQALFLIDVAHTLRQKDYEKLNRWARAYRSDVHGFTWSSGVSKSQMLVSALANPDFPEGITSPEETLLQWVVARPNDPLPRLALANSYHRDAWAARGSGFVGSVTEEGWQGFAENLQKMRTQLAAITVNEDTPPDYFRLLLSLAKDEGWELDRFEQCTVLLNRYAPDYVPAHQVVAQYLLPRWAGSFGESAACADRVADQIGGDRGTEVYARIAVQLGCFKVPGANARDNFLVALGFDADRTQRGLALVAREVQQATWLKVDEAFIAWVREDQAEIDRLLEEMRKIVPDPAQVWFAPVSYKSLQSAPEQPAKPNS